MTGVMEQIMNEGLMKGKEQGLRQGIASRNVEIIANMSGLGFSTEQIAQATGLSAEKVAEIAKGIRN